jgi:hypothetical protein
LLILETILTKIQKIWAVMLAAMLVVVMVLSTLHSGVLIGHEIWVPPLYLIRVEGLLEISGYFLLVLIGVELMPFTFAWFSKLRSSQWLERWFRRTEYCS